MPIDKIEWIDIKDICAQKINPNYMSSGAFEALQNSIYRNGWFYPIIIGENEIYDKDLDIDDEMTKVKNIIMFDDDKHSSNGKTAYSIETSNDEIRNKYKYSVIDGQQRSSIIRLGTYFLLRDNYKIDEEKAKEPGEEMLKVIAKRTDCKIPTVKPIQKNTYEEDLATTMIMNQSRGTHRFDTTKQIVYDLMQKGKSIDWIAKNLSYPKESIQKIMQINGLRSAFDDIDESEYFWTPEKDYRFEANEKYYQRREMMNFIEKCGEEVDGKNYKEQAERLGFVLGNIRESDIELAPNGTRRQGRIIKGFIPTVD